MKHKIEITEAGIIKSGFAYLCTILSDTTKSELMEFSKGILEENHANDGKVFFIFMTEAEKGFFNLELESLTINGLHKNAVLFEVMDEEVTLLKDKLYSVELDENLTEDMFNTYAIYRECVRRDIGLKEALKLTQEKTQKDEHQILNELQLVSDWWTKALSGREEY